MGAYDIPEDVEIDTDTTVSGEIEDGIGYVCTICNTFLYAPSERKIQEQFIRHWRQDHRGGLDYKSAYVENGEVKKL
ncbi:hypothetical protein [Halococcus sediminicola]|uniref:hypothetical protein n=1 Tax=Halococcus sediminicola TaxID=1264579 RepID=UPI0012ABD686|nr:hypothetical protein [Halococcus sediminicola]